MIAYIINGDVESSGFGIMEVRGEIDDENPDVFHFKRWLEINSRAHRYQECSANGLGLNWFLKPEDALPVIMERQKFLIQRYRRLLRQAKKRTAENIKALQHLTVPLVGCPFQPKTEPIEVL